MTEEPWITPVSAREAMEAGTGAGVRIAVLDTGIEANHPRFSGLILADDVVFEREQLRMTAQRGTGADLFGHGTAVASVIHRLAPKAEIGSFRVLNADKRGRTEIIADGARLALERGYDILHCSFGCRDLRRSVLEFKGWIDEAYVRGVHIVASCSNRDLFEQEWPSHFPSVIAVSVAPKGSEFFHFRRGALVEFTACGENVEVAWMNGQTQTDTGSSFAAPVVTGYLARLLSVHPGLPPAHIKDLLRRIATPWPQARH